MPFSCCVAVPVCCTDILSNTAQVLTSLVEALTDAKDNSVSQDDQLRLLEEALELFQRCLTIQEFQYAEFQAREASFNTTPTKDDAVTPPEATCAAATEPVPSDQSTASPSTLHATSTEPQEERWATIIEPVTASTLLDTILAQLETLTLLCTIAPPALLPWIEEYTQPLLATQLPTYISNDEARREAGLTRAKFLSALADANFRAGKIFLDTYESAVGEAWGEMQSMEGWGRDAECLVSYAETLTTFNDSARTVLSSQSGGEASDIDDPGSGAGAGSQDAKQHANESRWKALTAAQDALTKAAAVVPPSGSSGGLGLGVSSSSSPQQPDISLPRIHIARGDVELYRYALGRDGGYQPAVQSSSTLLKNAGIYYRGAQKIARARGLKEDEETEEEVLEAGVKGVVVRVAMGEGGAVKEVREWLAGGVNGKGAEAAVLREMVREGHISEGSELGGTILEA